jgi:hypothetical protein
VPVLRASFCCPSFNDEDPNASKQARDACAPGIDYLRVILAPFLSHTSFFQESLMADTTRYTIICPCCEATLTIDSQTGALLSHEEKSRPLASFDEMVKGLDKQKQVREQIFAQELNSMKDRDRILEQKFQDAMKRAEKDKDKPYRNPLDMD